MTDLQTIGVTFFGSCFMGSIGLACFGLAVYFRSTNVAPRCSARPPNTIYNPDAVVGGSQYRGMGNNPWTGWIPWVLSLSYETMFKGVPGTGTRDDGETGSLLRVNLDGIILLRFNSLASRVAFFALFPYVFILLPMYSRAGCDLITSELEPHQQNITNACVEKRENFTNYDRITIQSIPSLYVIGDDVGDGQTSALIRYYCVSIVCGIVTLYACYELEREWVVIQAIRRLFFLEFDHYGERQAELKKIHGHDINENSKQKQQNHEDDDEDDEEAGTGAGEGEDKPSSASTTQRHRNNKYEKITSRKKNRKKREAWIPDPESRETVPSISLYSVLVGNLPSVPTSSNSHHLTHIPNHHWHTGSGAADGDNDMETDIEQNWQMEVTKSFFDHCVPNQPGFSSSVAAVTVLPGASEITNAWTKWYTTASKLRRLQFIKEIIMSKKKDNGDNDSDDDDSDDDSDYGYDSDSDEFQSHNRLLKQLVESDNFLGYEQEAAYSREVAQSAAACCPYGCNEKKTKAYSLKVLKEEEKVIMKEITLAKSELKIAQKHASLTVNEADHALLMIKRRQQSELEQRKPELEQSDTVNAGDAIGKNDDKKESPTPQSFRFPNIINDNGSLFYSRNFDPDHELGLVSESEIPSTWNQLQHIVRLSEKGSEKLRTISNGALKLLLTNYKEYPTIARNWIKKIWKWALSRSKTMDVLGVAAKESSFAVVTFTSRQAALAARQCVVDNRGWNRLLTYDEIPVPPLADAAPFNILACRGCCRPVTVNINEKQKNVRGFIALMTLGLFFTCYSVPLTFVSALISPNKLNEIFPKLQQWGGSATFISGLSTGLLYTIFFAVCPQIFKLIANFGGTVTSVPLAELQALEYFWWFMIVAAFSSTSLSVMIIEGFNTGISVGSKFDEIIAAIATTIPMTTAPTWINWIIVRFGIVLPWNYLLQLNSFLFDFLGWKCCARMTRGGGPGGPIPYRIYVDTGMVLFCVFVLAPFSPIVVPFAIIYFLVSSAMLRRNLIFVYRPRYDAGGAFWPFLTDMYITSILASHFLLTIMMVMRRAYGPGLVAAFPFLPTIFFRKVTLKQFLKAFNDASLLQTSLLDGWDTSLIPSMQTRENFRRFLVDAHKAAYVPVCVAGSIITAEPAVVVPTDKDIECSALMEGNSGTPVAADDEGAAGALSPAITIVSDAAGVTTRDRRLQISTDNIEEENPIKWQQWQERSMSNLFDLGSPPNQFGAMMRRVSRRGGLGKVSLSARSRHSEELISVISEHTNPLSPSDTVANALSPSDTVSSKDQKSH